MSAVGFESVMPDYRHETAQGRLPSLPVSPTVLPAGSTAVYPGHGPCRIGLAVKRIVDGRTMMFYQLTVLDGRGGELFVPVEKAAIGLRSLMEKSEIPQLLAHLKKRAKPANNWRQRAAENLKLFNSGSPFDLAEVVASLTQQRDARPLTLGESVTLGKAKRLLVCEISEVIGEIQTTVEEQVDQALDEKAISVVESDALNFGKRIEGQDESCSLPLDDANPPGLEVNLQLQRTP